MVLASFLISYAPGELWWTARFATEFAGRQLEITKVNELQTFHRQYPQAEVGLSDDSHTPILFTQSLLVFEGTPLHIDFGSWADFAYAGLPEKRVCRIIGKLQST